MSIEDFVWIFPGLLVFAFFFCMVADMVFGGEPGKDPAADNYPGPAGPYSGPSWERPEPSAEDSPITKALVAMYFLWILVLVVTSC